MLVDEGRIMYTLSIVFNNDLDKVLMCYHEKQQAYNFIGGKMRRGEQWFNASYRELNEETGIHASNINLVSVRTEHVKSEALVYSDSCEYKMFVTTGVLNHDMTLHAEKNKLRWVSLKEFMFLLPKTFGDGNCLLYLNEAIKVLKDNGYKINSIY